MLVERSVYAEAVAVAAAEAEAQLVGDPTQPGTQKIGCHGSLGPLLLHRPSGPLLPTLHPGTTAP